jgi:3-hydroxyisobutyrate dehydrogenase-like beta-hydroxyacid dehydrogenase
MQDLRLSHVYGRARLVGMTAVAVLGLGRMGSAIAARLSGRLADDHDVRTWTRSGGGSPADVVGAAELVLLCLYDAAACRDVLVAVLPALSAGVTVVNTTTVGPSEAAELDGMVSATGATYLHAPVMGSTPAVAGGRLTILAGGKPTTAVESVLSVLGETVVLGSSAEAAGLKLVANGVLGDAVSSLRRTLRRGEALGLPREAVLEVVGRSALGRFVEGRRDVLDGTGARPPATFAAGALAKDLALLARSADTTSDASVAADTLLTTGSVAADDDISVLAVAEQDLSWLLDARLDVSPEVVADGAVLRPLHAYALTHATGDPAYLADAFLPTARIEGYREGAFASMDLEAFAGLFTGPAPDESTRSRRIERLDVRGSVATAVMTLHHGEVDFTDVFVLLRDPGSGRWRIASKAYERRAAG